MRLLQAPKSGVCLLGLDVAGTLVGCAVIVAGEGFVVVISLVVPGFVIIAAVVVIGVVAMLAVVVAARAAVAALVVVANVMIVTFVVAVMIVAAVVVVAAFAAAIMVAAAIATAFAIPAFGKGLGHAELDGLVDVQRQCCRQPDGEGRHGRRLQQAAQAILAKLAFVPPCRGILLARNRVHLSYPPD
jgi:hypothetical protein